MTLSLICLHQARQPGTDCQPSSAIAGDQAKLSSRDGDEPLPAWHL